MNGKLLSLLILPAIWCGYSHAESVGTVKHVVCHATGVSPLCLVTLNGAPSLAACATSGWHYSFDATTGEGKSLLSILLAAQLSKQAIAIGGKGTCSSPGSEDLRHAYMSTP